MSLVGAEVEISGESNSKHASFAPSDEQTPSPRPVTPVDDLHPAVTPPRPAESLFLGTELKTQHISAAALAQQIHLQHATPSTTTSIATDDFYSTADYNSAAEYMTAASLNHNSSDPNFVLSLDDSESTSEDFFGKDALARGDYLTSGETTPKFQDSRQSNNNMSSTEMHADPAEKVYNAAKGIWSWGKGIMIVSPFLGLAEGVAGKVVGMAGSDLPAVDGTVKDQLASLDNQVLNPAIAKIVQVLLGAAHKTEDTFKPIIEALLKPLGLIKNEAETPEMTTTVKSSTTSAASASMSSSYKTK